MAKKKRSSLQNQKGCGTMGNENQDQVKAFLKKVNHPNRRRHRLAVEKKSLKFRYKRIRLYADLDDESKALMQKLKRLFVREACLTKIFGAHYEWLHSSGIYISWLDGRVHLQLSYRVRYKGFCIDRTFKVEDEIDVLVEAWELFSILETIGTLTHP